MTSVSAILREAGAALAFNRMRSVLTVMSLAWGVTCFVVLYSYGEGFGATAEGAFAAVGQNLDVMFGGQTSSQAGGERSGRKIQLNLEDAELIRENTPTVGAVSAETLIGEATVVRGYRQQNITIRAVEPAYGRIRNMSLTSGRWLNGEDYAEKRRVAILGAQAAVKLFGEIPPEGEAVTINGLRFDIIGLLRTKTQLANYNEPDNECIFIPLSTGGLLKDITHPQDIVWTPANPVFEKATVADVRAVMARLHNFSPTDPRAVQILSFNDFRRIVDTLAIALRALLGLIGSVTLAIGGVGLANIMLVSVTQRTREIGMLKAIGATRRAVLASFLAEAMAIVTLGGILGMLAGWALTVGIGTLPLFGAIMKNTTGSGDIHLRVSGFALLVSAGVLEAIGLIAGLIPAVRASKLDPIEALRYE